MNMNNFLTKYNSLRQQPWTHILILFTYIYLGCILYDINFIIVNDCLNNDGLYPWIIYFISTCIFLSGIIIAAIIAIINLFLKKKVTNNFFTKNKLYGFLWHIGNILFILFIIINLWFTIELIITQLCMGEVGYFTHQKLKWCKKLHLSLSNSPHLSFGHFPLKRGKRCQM